MALENDLEAALAGLPSNDGMVKIPRPTARRLFEVAREMMEGQSGAAIAYIIDKLLNADPENGATLNDIAAETGLTRSTVKRHMDVAHLLGLVERVEGIGYEPRTGRVPTRWRVPS